MAHQAAKRQSSTSQEFESSSNPTLIPNPDIFSDDFALQPFEIQDSTSSFPSDQNVDSPMSSINLPRRLGGSTRSTASAHESPRRSRSSLTYGLSRGFLSRRERPLSHNNTTSIGSISDAAKTESVPHRSISAASNFSTPRAQSPYQGATGPSHPYGMYPQDIEIVRSPGSVMNSTLRMPERSYAGPDEPTQPYGMYSQNIVLEDQSNPDPNMNRPQPGFPGRDPNYSRRFRPDGEEPADIVGPDGYTEQLPPYSRYANGIPPKNGTSTTGDIEDETRNQSGGSQNSLNTAQFRDVVGASVADNSSTLLNPLTDGANFSPEGGHFKERVKEKGKKRICYGKIPMWVVMVLLLLAAALIGAVFGGVLGRADKKSSDDNSTKPVGETLPVSTIFATTVTTTSLVDAVPITSTTDLPSLPTGSYRISLNNLSSETNDCLTEEKQNAWNCNTETVMTVLVNFADPSQVHVSFSYNDTQNSENSKTRYGPQPPGFSGLVTMTPMMDKGDWRKGPAYVFHHEFDKVVILHEDAFNTPKKKRWFNDELYEDDKFLERRHDTDDPYIGDSDRPWYCFWNGTVLEGFIFVTEDLANSTNTTATNSDHSSVYSNGNETAPHTITESAGLSVSTFPIPLEDISTIPSPPLASEISVPFPTSVSWKKRQETTLATDEITSSGMSKYPKVIKIEERRNVVNSVPPYCQQMEFSKDQIPSPIDDQSFPLNEYEKTPTSTSSYSSRRGLSGILSIFRRGTSAWSSSCGCVWIST